MPSEALAVSFILKMHYLRILPDEVTQGTELSNLGSFENAVVAFEAQVVCIQEPMCCCCFSMSHQQLSPPKELNSKQTSETQMAELEKCLAQGNKRLISRLSTLEHEEKDRRLRD